MIQWTAVWCLSQAVLDSLLLTSVTQLSSKIRQSVDKTAGKIRSYPPHMSSASICNGTFVACGPRSYYFKKLQEMINVYLYYMYILLSYILCSFLDRFIGVRGGVTIHFEEQRKIHRFSTVYSKKNEAIVLTFRRLGPFPTRILFKDKERNWEEIESKLRSESDIPHLKTANKVRSCTCNSMAAMTGTHYSWGGKWFQAVN